MSTYVSQDVSDLKEELEHSELYHFAACSMEARTVIATVAIIMLSKMLDHASLGYPGTLDLRPGMDFNPESAKLWREKLISMRRAFEFTLPQTMDLTDEQKQFVDEGLFGDIPEPIRNYLDYDAIARDLGMDYSETTIAGTRVIYRCS